MDTDFDSVHLPDQLQLGKVSPTCIVIDLLQIAQVAYHLHVGYLLDYSLAICRS